MSKKYIRRALGCLIFLFGLCFLWPAPAAAAEGGQVDSYLVGGMKPAAFLLSDDLPLEHVVLDIFRTDDLNYAQELVDLGLAEYMEPDYPVVLFDTAPAAPHQPTPSWSDGFLGVDFAASCGLNGENIRIAVVDSGIDPGNGNLEGALIEAGKDYTQKKPTGNEGNDQSAVLPDPSSLADNIGHGSAVAQMIVGCGKDGAVRGIAPKATLVSFRAFRSGYDTTTGELARAVYDAFKNFDCQIINMSWGFLMESALSTQTRSGTEQPQKPAIPRTVAEVVKLAEAEGVILVAASGNESSFFPAGSMVYPAAFDEVISVGNLAESKEIASSSIRNNQVTVCAPGQWLPFLSGQSSYHDSGTSFSSPAVAGLAALIKQQLPEITPAQMRRAMRDCALDLGDPGRDDAYGYGAISAETLFRRSWFYSSTMNGQTIAKGWGNSEASTIYSAVYSGDHQMVSLEIIEVPPAFTPMELIVAAAEPDMCQRVFLLNLDSAPISDSFVSQ